MFVDAELSYLQYSVANRLCRLLRESRTLLNEWSTCRLRPHFVHIVENFCGKQLI